MATIQRFNVMPSLPEKLKPLMKVAHNLWWVWNFEAIELFRRLDVELWRECQHNPLALLGAISQKKLNEAADSESFMAHMKRVEDELDYHLNKKSWFEETHGVHRDAHFAYFSAEFGIHESLPIYSGGLGVLAGDHLKSASELGLPLCGVGLLYRLGYFHQYLSFDGWQQERYPETDFHNIPVQLVKNIQAQPLVIGVEMPGRTVYAQIWEVAVGCIKLYLLDTNILSNSPEDRAITDQLYVGDAEMRIKQELILGIGGVRALKAMGVNVSTFHMNEGHSAFLAIERIREAIVEKGLSFAEAYEFVTASSVFTTHTPVPAGNERFTIELIDKYLSIHYKHLGLSKEEFLAFGRENPSNKEETFCMTVLAIKTAAGCNGVAKLHGRVSREMWQRIWPSLPVHEVPIDHVTNGIQTLSWTSDEMMRLLNRYLGPRWIDNPVDKDIWQAIDSIPASELWRCRERLRERLVGFSRKRLKAQLIARGVSKSEIEYADSVLDSEALTIGFARRFATYKRATLIMRDIDRLAAFMGDRDRPVQFVFAGKAHPKDTPGKEFIKQIIEISRKEGFRNRIVFIEDYDINIARYLVQGVDVWLNNPIRPQEASGTSGMKVIPNGGLNLSILDGWWDEGYNGDNGWAIGRGEEYADQDYQDTIESQSLYNILEKEVIPCFYDRGTDGIPKEWVRHIKNSMKTLAPEFNTNRMVQNYTENFYLRAHDSFVKLSGDGYKEARNLASWKKHVTEKWNTVSIADMGCGESTDVTVGARVKVNAKLHLGELTPDDVLVELYFGSLNPNGDIINGAALPMVFSEKQDGGNYLFEGQMLCLKSGQFGYTVRVIPHHACMTRKFEPGMITWA